MTITKYGHCCLLLEIEGKRILTDPGGFSHGFAKLTNLDLILITHEHPDHLHTESLQALLANNPDATVVCNASVGKLLTEQGIAYTNLSDRETATVAGIALKPYNGPHVEIINDFGLVENTGYLIGGGSFFYPGDAYTVPEERIQVLAAPVAGPWLKVAEAIRYVLAVSPAQVVPVHDAVLSKEGRSVVYPHFLRELTEQGIQFTVLEETEPASFAS